jgi:hypothetical protein
MIRLVCMSHFWMKQPGMSDVNTNSAEHPKRIEPWNRPKQNSEWVRGRWLSGDRGAVGRRPVEPIDESAVRADVADPHSNRVSIGAEARHSLTWRTISTCGRSLVHDSDGFALSVARSRQEDQPIWSHSRPDDTLDFQRRQRAIRAHFGFGADRADLL